MTHENRRFDWLRYVALHNARGEEWVREYRHPDTSALAEQTDRALGMLREQRQEEAACLLEEFLDRLSTSKRRGMRPSIHWVMLRWYHAVQAYALYLKEDYGAAEDQLKRAHEAVERAIATESVLLPLADHCADFRFQKLRIDRNRHRWTALFLQAEDLKRLARSEEPLCEVAGEKIFMSDLRDFLLFTPGISAEESRWLKGLMSEDKRLDFVDRFLVEVCSLQGFVIPYESAVA